MISVAAHAYIETVPSRCRTCFTCVRECPAKAIRIQEGQAELLATRCIACGNCVRVCSQGAKRVVSTFSDVEKLLDDPARRVAACLAPSFPAEFVDYELPRLVGALRALGFSLVTEVAFGADLVAERYVEMMSGNESRRFIATTCPAVVSFVEKQYPELVPNLMPIVSPMTATARALRHEYGENVAIVFIGPCVGKKKEAEAGNDVDEAITFRELRELFERRGVDPRSSEPSSFNAPHPNLGALFSLSRGMLQAAGLMEDLTTNDVVAAEGRSEFVETIREFASGSLNARLLEVLCCPGCIMGVGMTTSAPQFRRRASVGAYVRETVTRYDKRRWHEDMRQLGSLDLSRTFTTDDQRLPIPPERELRSVLERIGKREPADELDCGACGYDTCRDHAIAIWRGLAESEMCLPWTIDTLHHAVGKLADSHKLLASTQEALMQSEKLASMGQLAAGIAHEVNNPLGVVLMYSHLLQEEVPEDSELRHDLALLSEQAERCRRIVSGLLDFARQNRVLYQDVDVRALMDKALRSVPLPAGVEVVREYGEQHAVAELDPDQMVQVLTNLITNAYAAMAGGGILTARVLGTSDQVCFEVADTGCGIPEDHRTKIFEPFFTTKNMGEGTGLGLSVAYGIIKMHRGQITLVSQADPDKGPTGSTFTVRLPRRGRLE